MPGRVPPLHLCRAVVAQWLLACCVFAESPDQLPTSRCIVPAAPAASLHLIPLPSAVLYKLLFNLGKHNAAVAAINSRDTVRARTLAAEAVALGGSSACAVSYEWRMMEAEGECNDFCRSRSFRALQLGVRQYLFANVKSAKDQERFWAACGAPNVWPLLPSTQHQRPAHFVAVHWLSVRLPPGVLASSHPQPAACTTRIRSGRPGCSSSRHG